jgi:hypothetical protein
MKIILFWLAAFLVAGLLAAGGMQQSRAVIFQPSPSPQSETYPRIEIDGPVLQAILAACDQVKANAKIDCRTNSEFVTHGKIFVTEGKYIYVVDFAHWPPRGFDDFTRAIVTKP